MNFFHFNNFFWNKIFYFSLTYFGYKKLNQDKSVFYNDKYSYIDDISTPFDIQNDLGQIQKELIEKRIPEGTF